MQEDKVRKDKHAVQCSQISPEEFKEQVSVLVKTAKKHNPKVDAAFIECAAKLAYDAHKGQKRASGEDFFTHCYNVALMLAELKLDYRAISAGLLHDVLEDTSMPAARIQKELDKETLELIQSVTKIKNIGQNRILRDETARAETLRKIILATAKDIRVIILKLVDRLHNMRTLKYLPEDDRKRISQETLDIYAPIAHKLGMQSIKAELEDLSLRFLDPEFYQELKGKVSLKKEEREANLSQLISEIRAALDNEGIRADIYGRVKHFYSIYKKIKKEDKEFNDIYDLNAVRIVTGTIPECYSILGIVHKIWKPLPKRFKDYIALPKSNGYQSLHTTVIGSHGRILEVQIRTREMHLAAEEGIAAHWRYKGNEKDQQFDRKLEWLKQALNWMIKSEDADKFVETLKLDFFEKEIYVFTPKGDPVALPENSTPIDFAYAVHTDVGNHCKSAKVNGDVVSLDHILSPGDIVEILVAKNVLPSRSWLSFVKSTNTIVKIKKALGIEYDISPKHKGKKQANKEYASSESADKDSADSLSIRDGALFFEGKKIAPKMPKCCNPKIGIDKIRAFKSKDGKIVIHKANCINLYSYRPESEIAPHVTGREEKISLKLKIYVGDRIGLLADILALIAKEGHNLSGLKTKFTKSNTAIVTLEIVQTIALDSKEIMAKISKIRGVTNVKEE